MRYAPSDHEDDDKYPSIHQDDIIEPGISGVDNNINDHDAYKNTDDANTNIHNNSDINTTDNVYELQPPNDANTKDKDTKYDNTEDEDSLENTGVETIDDPVSQLDKTTGVGTVDDTDDILQPEMDQ